jgi:hypothetical protein
MRVGVTVTVAPPEGLRPPRFRRLLAEVTARGQTAQVDRRGSSRVRMQHERSGDGQPSLLQLSENSPLTLSATFTNTEIVIDVITI